MVKFVEHRIADRRVVRLIQRWLKAGVLEEGRRVRRFGLLLDADEARIVEFGRYAERNRRNRGPAKPETFNFLGITRSGAKTRKGHFTVRRSMMRPRWQGKLRVLQEELRRQIYTPLREQGAYLRSVLLGHFRYYGVPMNGPALCAFRGAAGSLWRTVRRRRSQGNPLSWRRISRYTAKWFPPASVCHPYPLVRLGVIPKGSRMR